MKDKPGLVELRNRINVQADDKHAKTMQWFFKTGPGEYGEGDVFAGLKVPAQRKIAKEFTHLNFSELTDLLSSEIHEERLIALLILVNQYQKSDALKKEEIFNYYLDNIKGINNWDLVDLSAPKIVGEHLLSRDKKLLFKFAKSKNLWERRISILSTYTFIKAGKLDTTLAISDILLGDEHDLIHKAVGWMLREVGKQDLSAEEKFLKSRYKKMPRTMLRYAIERFPDSKRKKYLQGKI